MIRNKLKRLTRKSSKESTTFLSFNKPLIQLCKIINPQQILEFGPGYSTQLFLNNTHAKIISIEENYRWYLQYKITILNPRVRMIHKPMGWDLQDLIFITDDYSFVFIDGGDRVSELTYMYDKLPLGGIIYLHDAHREDYEKGIRLYPYIFFPERHSAILSKDRSIYEHIRKNLPIDYSCKCPYCSSYTRRAYFNQFSEKVDK